MDSAAASAQKGPRLIFNEVEGAPLAGPPVKALNFRFAVPLVMRLNSPNRGGEG